MYGRELHASIGDSDNRGHGYLQGEKAGGLTLTGKIKEELGCANVVKGGGEQDKIDRVVKRIPGNASLYLAFLLVGACLLHAPLSWKN